MVIAVLKDYTSGVHFMNDTKGRQGSSRLSAWGVGCKPDVVHFPAKPGPRHSRQFPSSTFFTLRSASSELLVIEKKGWHRREWLPA